jgi:hypothetical protein
MKTPKTLFAFILILRALLSARAQGAFQNLDFEQPNIVPIVGAGQNQVEASAALPGWTVYLGGNSVNYVLYDNVTLGSPAVSVQDSLSAIMRLQGNYLACVNQKGTAGCAFPV